MITEKILAWLADKPSHFTEELHGKCFGEGYLACADDKKFQIHLLVDQLENTRNWLIQKNTHGARMQAADIKRTLAEHKAILRLIE